MESVFHKTKMSGVQFGGLLFVYDYFSEILNAQFTHFLVRLYNNEHSCFVVSLKMLTTLYIGLVE